jgi:hypothetical protein
VKSKEIEHAQAQETTDWPGVIARQNNRQRHRVSPEDEARRRRAWCAGTAPHALGWQLRVIESRCSTTSAVGKTVNDVDGAGRVVATRIRPQDSSGRTPQEHDARSSRLPKRLGGSCEPAGSQDESPARTAERPRSIVARRFQDATMHQREVLVDLDLHAPMRRRGGVKSSSPASSAA